MKPAALILLIFSTVQVFAQDKDTVSYRFGFLVDFESVAIHQLGFKYRASPNLSFSLRVRVSSMESNTSNDIKSALKEFDTYTLTFGTEYAVVRYSSFSFFPALAMGLNKTKSREPFYYYQQGPSAYTHTSYYSSGYFFQAGLGAECFLQEHLSLSAYQLSQVQFSRDKSIDEKGQEATTTSTTYFLAYTRITIGFYF